MRAEELWKTYCEKEKIDIDTPYVNCTPCQGQFQRCESVPLDGYRFYYPRKLFKSTLAEPLSMDSLTS